MRARLIKITAAASMKDHLLYHFLTTLVSVRLEHEQEMNNCIVIFNKLANEALQSTKAAHKRIDELSKRLDELEKKIEEDKKQNKDDKKWMIGTAIGAVALILNLIKGGVGH